VKDQGPNGCWLCSEAKKRRNARAPAGTLAAGRFSPEGAKFDSPGQRPGERGHPQIGSPERAGSRSGEAWISPFQGCGANSDSLPQGVALGCRITPLRGWTRPQPRPRAFDCSSPAEQNQHPESPLSHAHLTRTRAGNPYYNPRGALRPCRGAFYYVDPSCRRDRGVAARQSVIRPSSGSGDLPRRIVRLEP
jgi:hypothetical protein